MIVTVLYVYNGHADVTALIDQSNGNAIVTYYYDAWGNITDQTGSANNNIGYAGYQFDKETGLYYLNARMYDPATARFLQADTYTGDPNDPLSLNLYTYCHNEPLMYTDPSGHWEVGVDDRLSPADQKRIKYLSIDYDAYMDAEDIVSAERARRAAVAIRQTGGIGYYEDRFNYTTEENLAGGFAIGSSGSVVKKIQQALKNKGYSLGRYGADSDFGLYTKAAVIRYQIDNDLIYDGVVGGNTGRSLGVDIYCKNIPKGAVVVNYGNYQKIIEPGQQQQNVSETTSQATDSSVFGSIGNVSQGDSNDEVASKANQCLPLGVKPNDSLWFKIYMTAADAYLSVSGAESFAKLGGKVYTALIKKYGAKAALELGDDVIKAETKAVVDSEGAGNKVGSLNIVEGGSYSASEINAANYMKNLGYEVTLRPPTGTRVGGGTSDLVVNGTNYDVYTPVTNNVSSIISSIAKKNSQTTGIVLDLSKTNATAEQLSNALARVKGSIESQGKVCNIKDIVIMPK